MLDSQDLNASNIEKDWNHLTALAEKYDVTLSNSSDEISLVALQGPKSRQILDTLTAANLESLDYYHFGIADIDGLTMIISRTGYTGELGYELYHDPKDAEQLWSAIMKAGEAQGIGPVGLGAALRRVDRRGRSRLPGLQTY